MGVTLKSKHSKSYDLGYVSFNRLRSDIADAVPKNPKEGTVTFLHSSDCGGKLSVKECEDLLYDMGDMKDRGVYYGYTSWREEDKLTIERFKEVLCNCIIHRCILRWY